MEKIGIDPVLDQIKLNIEYLADNLKKKVTLEENKEKLFGYYDAHREMTLNEAEFTKYKEELMNYLEEHGMAECFERIELKEINREAIEKRMEKQKETIESRIDKLEKIVDDTKESIKALKGLYRDSKRHLNYSYNLLRQTCPAKFAEAEKAYEEHYKACFDKPTHETIGYSKHIAPQRLTEVMEDYLRQYKEEQDPVVKAQLKQQADLYKTMLQFRVSNLSLLNKIMHKVDTKYFKDGFIKASGVIDKYNLLHPYSEGMNKKAEEPFRRYAWLLGKYTPEGGQADTTAKENSFKEFYWNKFDQARQHYNKKLMFDRRKKILKEVVKI